MTEIGRSKSTRPKHSKKEVKKPQRKQTVFEPWITIDKLKKFLRQVFIDDRKGNGGFQGFFFLFFFYSFSILINDENDDDSETRMRFSFSKQMLGRLTAVTNWTEVSVNQKKGSTNGNRKKNDSLICILMTLTFSHDKAPICLKWMNHCWFLKLVRRPSKNSLRMS